MMKKDINLFRKQKIFYKDIFNDLIQNMRIFENSLPLYKSISYNFFKNTKITRFQDTEKMLEK